MASVSLMATDVYGVLPVARYSFLQGINISRLFYKPLTDDSEGTFFMVLRQFYDYEVKLDLLVALFQYHYINHNMDCL